MDLFFFQVVAVGAPVGQSGLPKANYRSPVHEQSGPKAVSHNTYATIITRLR
jgi:hypothetical protein